MKKVSFETLEPGIGKITLTDPDSLNAMGEEMAGDFRAVVDSIRPRVSEFTALILTGAGKAFSAGGDLRMLDQKRQIPGEQNRLLMHRFYDSFLGIRELGIPLIAAINGAAVGAGLCVASACDIRIAAQSAKLGFTFVRLGLHPGMGATYFLPRLLGAGHSAELLLTGRVIDAEQALRIGLVSKVVSDDAVQREALAVASEIAECGPEAVRQLLQSLRETAPSLSQALAREATCQAINYRSDEFAEGVRAIMEKRKPKFGK